MDMKYNDLSPSTLLSPVPVALVSCADGEDPSRQNLITIAWAGTVNSEPPMVSISVRKSRYSHDMIRSSGEFVINLTDEKLCQAADFCGVRSGRDLDKAAAAGLRLIPAKGMRFAPAVEGAPVYLSCRVIRVEELGSHDLFLAEITAVQARADLMDERGGLHLEKAGLVGYNHGLYQRLGEVLGFFGWSVARPEIFRRRMEELGAEKGYELKSARFLAHDMLRQVLRPGDTAVDATMGNGHDTLFLCETVGPAGRVYAFDVQPQALQATEARLRENGVADRARLLLRGHEHMAEEVEGPVDAVLFNLGWLPGGDHRVTTRWETTRAALETALRLLRAGGLLTVCAYPGHAEGDRERKELVSFLSALDNRKYNVLRQSFLNAGPGAPECLAVQKMR